MLARTTFALLSILASGIALDAAAPPQAHRDAYGDPLPPGGAVARLGTVRLRHVDEVRGLVYSADGKTLASAAHSVRLWSAKDGRPLVRVGPVAGMGGWRPRPGFALSPDGKFLATQEREVVALWDASSGERLRQLKGGEKNHQGCLAFSPDGKTLAAGASACAVCLWDVAGGRPRVLTPDDRDRGEPILVAFLAQGKQVLLVSQWERFEGRSLNDDKDPTRKTDYFIECHVYDVATGKQARHRTMKAGRAQQTGPSALSPDGKAHAVAAGRRVVLWDVGSGKQRLEIDAVAEDGRRPIESLAFTPDGKSLAVGEYDPSGGNVAAVLSVHSVADGKCLRRRRHVGTWAQRLAYSPDGERLAVGNLREVVILDAATLARRSPQRQLPGSPQGFGPEGKSVVCLSGEYRNETITTWDARTGALTRRAGDLNGVALCLTSDGLLVGRNYGAVLLLDPRDGQTLRTWKGHRTQPYAAAFSPDGRSLATGGWDRALVLWDLKRGEEVWKHVRPVVHQQNERRRPLGFSADGAAVVVLENDDTIRLFSLSSGKEIRQLAVKAEEATLSPDGRLLLTGPDPVRLVDLTAPWEPRVVELKLPKTWSPVSSEEFATAFSPDGRLLAVTRKAAEVSLYEAASGAEVRRLRGHEAAVGWAAFSADGRLLVTGSGRDGTALVWDVTGRAPEVIWRRGLRRRIR